MLMILRPGPVFPVNVTWSSVAFTMPPAWGLIWRPPPLLDILVFLITRFIGLFGMSWMASSEKFSNTQSSMTRVPAYAI